MSKDAVHMTRAELEQAYEGMKLALDAAVRALMPYEEPGRFFGSPLYVSLASVLTGNTNEACWTVINEFIDADNKREEAGIPVEHIPVHSISVKLGRDLDSYMLPADVVDQRVVHLIINAMRERDDQLLRMMTQNQVMALSGETLHPAELQAALESLRRDDVAVLKPIWQFFDGDEEYEIADEERKEILSSGIFVHPHTGEAVPNFRDNLGVYYGLNTSNTEFMAWKNESRNPTPGM